MFYLFLNENTVRTEGVQITLYFITSSISLVKYCCFMKTWYAWIIQSMWNGNKYDMNAILKCECAILVFGTFLTRTATLYFWRWFCSFQLELARPNYINWKIEIFERFLVIQKNTCKIWAPQNRLCKSWIEDHLKYLKTFIDPEILLGSQETVNQMISCQHTLSKKLVQHIGGVWSC